MLIRNFDPQKKYRVVLYLRMSSDKQNPRSPDQQEAEILRLIALLKLPWIIVKVYRDDAASGRQQRNRPQYKQMMIDIRTGALKVDLVVVDTLARLGRHEELDTVRRELKNKHGCLVLTADTRFADPTTPQGETHATFQNLQARAENREKAHNVLRGKRDVVKQGYWPGGPTPFGYELRPTFVPGTHHVAGSKLHPCEKSAWIVGRLFRRALETGHGQSKLARYLNECADVPEEFKPFNGPTVGSWLQQELYYGEMVFPKKHTDVVDDLRRVENATEDEQIRIPDFCPPIVEKAIWMEVAATRAPRSRARANGEGKLIKPLAPGMTLSYLLTGLVRCGLCGASMRPVSSGRKSSTGTTYAYYGCPRAVDGLCENRTNVHEGRLRDWVLEVVRRRLFQD